MVLCCAEMISSFERVVLATITYLFRVFNTDLPWGSCGGQSKKKGKELRKQVTRNVPISEEGLEGFPNN